MATAAAQTQRAEQRAGTLELENASLRIAVAQLESQSKRASAASRSDDPALAEFSSAVSVRAHGLPCTHASGSKERSAVVGDMIADLDRGHDRDVSHTVAAMQEALVASQQGGERLRVQLDQLSAQLLAETERRVQAEKDRGDVTRPAASR